MDLVATCLRRVGDTLQSAELQLLSNSLASALRHAPALIGSQVDPLGIAPKVDGMQALIDADEARKLAETPPE